MNTFWKKLKNLFTVPDTFESDDLRRRQALNFVLIVFLLVIIGFLFVIGWDENKETIVTKIMTNPDASYIPALFLLIVFTLALFGLNRWEQTPANLVGWVFVLGVVFFLPVAEFPQELIRGRSIFAWAVPITLSVVVLPPASVFVVDFFITFLFMYWGGFRYETFQIYTIVQIYMVSFITWLGMSMANKAIRDARRESQKNRAILDGVADGVVVVGVDNRVSLANSVAFELMDGEMPKILSAAESIEVRGRILSLRWSNVQGVGRIAIVRDVTRQTEIERAKDALLSVVSHEMRTPLSAILGFAELLKVRPAPDMAERIRVNTLRMIRMVDNMLDLAQLQASSLKLHPEKFLPRVLADEVNKLLCPYAMEKQIAFQIVISEALPDEIIGDFHRYRQVLINLADNAIKFTREGGRVDILLAPDTAETDQWQMIVRDTGIGIPPECLPDVFLPFRRASDYTKRPQQGTGLGLSIAKRIAQLARGDIEVKSVVGHGSTFLVTLPINGGAG